MTTYLPSYVHRLIQSKADGKLVEIPGPESQQIDDEMKEGILEVRSFPSSASPLPNKLHNP